MVASQSRLSDLNILDFADKISTSHIVPIINSLKQEFFITSSVETLVAAQSHYSIHYRAVGRTVRELQILDEDDDVICDLPLVSLEDAYRNETPVAGPYSSHFEGDKIVILPTPATGVTDQLKQFFALKQSRLIKTTEARTVVSKTATTITLSGTDLPDEFIADALVDFIQRKSGCSILGMDKAIVSVLGQVVTFATGDIPTALAVGDYLAPAEYSPMIMLPDEAFDLLEVMTAQRCLRAGSDFEGANAFEDDRKEAKTNMIDLLTPRQKGEPVVIINQRGLLRGRQGYSRFSALFRV